MMKTTENYGGQQLNNEALYTKNLFQAYGDKHYIANKAQLAGCSTTDPCSLVPQSQLTGRQTLVDNLQKQVQNMTQEMGGYQGQIAGLQQQNAGLQQNFNQVVDAYNDMYQKFDAAKMETEQYKAQRYGGTQLNAEKMALCDNIAEKLQSEGKEVNTSNMKQLLYVALGITIAAAAKLAYNYIQFRRKRPLQFMGTMTKHDGSQIDISREKSIKATEAGYSRDFVPNFWPPRTATSKQITDEEKHYLGFGGNIYRDDQKGTLNESRMASFLDSSMLDDEQNQLQAEQQQQQIQQAQIINSLMGAFGNSIAGHKFASQEAKLEAAQFTAGQGIKPTANGYQDANGTRAYAEKLYNLLFAQNPAWFI